MASLNDVASQLKTKINKIDHGGFVGFGSKSLNIYLGSANEVVFEPLAVDNSIYFNYRNFKNKVTGFVFGNFEQKLPITCGELRATKTYNAVWNDYAEFYPRGEQTEAGDIIQLDINSKEEKYIKATSQSTTVVGVHSDTYGHLIGGEDVPEGKDFIKYNLENYIPVGLVGRVNCKIIGAINKGDRIVVSEINGVGRKFNPETDNVFQIVGMAVEDKTTENIEKIKVNFRGGGGRKLAYLLN